MTSAMVKSNMVSEWFDGWAPEYFFGGRQGRSALDGLAVLVEEAASGSPLGTADLIAAFDHIVPKDALEVMVHMGMPEAIARFVLSVWGAQRRLLQMGAYVDSLSEDVGNSLPQGDGLAVVAMLAWLVAPACDIEEHFGASVRQVVYCTSMTGVGQQTALECANSSLRGGDHGAKPWVCKRTWRRCSSLPWKLPAGGSSTRRASRTATRSGPWVRAWHGPRAAELWRRRWEGSAAQRRS